MITQEKIPKNCLKAPFEQQYFTDVLMREFPICDVAGGQFGKSLFFIKGNPYL